MTPERLRNEARRFFAQCQSRIEGTGTEQYYDPETQTQAFETMTMPQLFEEARQEAYDLANYALMISLRIDMLQSRTAQEEPPQEYNDDSYEQEQEAYDYDQYQDAQHDPEPYGY